jgi:alpha-L-rhamnosidase
VEEAAKMQFVAEKRDVSPWNGLSLTEATYADIQYRCNVTGFFEMTFTVAEACEVYFLFDEIYNGENVDYLRMACNNIHTVFAVPGTYHLMTQEPYTFRYLRVACRKGAVKFDAITIRRAGFPEIGNVPKIDDPELKRIYDAAVETFRQNTYDIYMDCPSRERAGWLCDSFFTSRVERFLTGKTMVEENFLANFIDHGQDPWLPEGMINMCYPSDHPDGCYIPNWAMWYVLELEEYLAFTGNRAFVDRAKDLCYGLVNFFRKYRNADGILEKLESWVFVEWSHANDLVQDVNYPSNMLYARMLRAVANIYDDPSLIPEAEVIEEYIRKNTMINGFFCDNAYRRENGSLELSGECTETCQYYAFYMGIATPETYPELWKKLTTDFGPQRKQTGAYPEIFFSNAFIGNYLRLDLLFRYGLADRMVEEIRGYFLYMADKTGTLWEHDSDFASCNHGFASYVAVLLRKALNV